MSIPPGKILACVNGVIGPAEHATVSVLDRGHVFGDGIYEVVRVDKGRLHGMDRHWRRLDRSLRALQMPAVDLNLLRSQVEATLAASGHTDATIYLQVTRGTAPRAHAFPADTPANTLILVQHFPDDKAHLREKGAGVITHPDLRWARCDIKSINLLGSVLAAEAARRAGCVEAVLIREDGVVTECAHSSLFAVVDGVLRTHPLDPRILPGITREIVLELAADLGIPCRQKALRSDELRGVDELFLTSTTSRVLPLVELDGKPVGNGKPGPVTCSLRDAFTAWEKADALKPPSSNALNAGEL
jgi:D-alanine transaminase